MMMMTMKSGLSGLFLLLLLSSTVSGLGSVVSKNYWQFGSLFTWQDAQTFCRRSNYYTDLATIYTQSDTGSLSQEQYDAWIGLYKDPTRLTNNWIWSNGGNNYLWVWANDEPDPSDNCAYVSYYNKRFYGTNCGGSLFFFCYQFQGNDFKYTFIPQSKTWSEAQQFCRENYNDLAVFEQSSDLNSTLLPQDLPVWIGLYRDGQTWKWSTGLSDYRNWASGEPGNNGNCVSISSKSKEMATQNCSAKLPVMCIRDNLVLVNENKTWEEALKHCRALTSTYQSNIRYELVSVQPGADHNNVMRKVMEANAEEVWTGLRFLAGQWLWVNGADMLYSDLPLCPLVGQHCGALSKNDTGTLETRDCLEKRNFLCYST